MDFEIFLTNLSCGKIKASGNNPPERYGASYVQSGGWKICCSGGCSGVFCFLGRFGRGGGGGGGGGGELSFGVGGGGKVSNGSDLRSSGEVRSVGLASSELALVESLEDEGCSSCSYSH